MSGETVQTAKGALWPGLALLVAAILLGAASGAAADSAAGNVDRALLAPVGFLDGNLDGVNDFFADADGDGEDDVSGLPYAHDFSFRDADGDARNDLFVDADGDGENDLVAVLRAGGGEGPVVVEIDGNADGVNDVLGACELTGDDLGFVIESSGRRIPFVDEDGDGLNDLHRTRQLKRSRVRFVDRDGDGLQDGRMLHGRDSGERGVGVRGGGRNGSQGRRGHE